MNKPILTGSCDFTALMEAAKAGNPAFKRAENKRVYFDFIAWEKEQQDKFGNNLSFQLNRPKDSEAKQPYFGNAKMLLNQIKEEPKEAKQETEPETNEFTYDLPF